MARPHKARTLESLPVSAIYIPAGWTKAQVAPVEVAIEDFEIMRLVDGRGYSIVEAGAKVGVSRSTAGRMLERARRVIALAIEKRAPLYLDASEDLVLEPPSMDGALLVRGAGGQSCDGALAVSCLDANLETPVERIFGRSPAFVMVGVDGKVQGLVENPGFGVKRNAAKVAVDLLKAHGVRRVVAGRFGPEAIKALAGAGVQPLVATGFKLGQAIEFFNQEK
jgi:predicted DNA-binding protein (UPF0251 family)/predicted Fe-Mo cluster-binding NifX family protein